MTSLSSQSASVVPQRNRDRFLHQLRTALHVSETVFQGDSAQKQNNIGNAQVPSLCPPPQTSHHQAAASLAEPRVSRFRFWDEWSLSVGVNILL